MMRYLVMMMMMGCNDSTEAFLRLNKGIPTSFLLLHCQVAPWLLHAVTKAHPQVCLLTWRHRFPPLLDIGEGDIGDRMRSATGL